MSDDAAVVLLVATLAESGHDVADCRQFYGDPPVLSVDTTAGIAFAVCRCGATVEVSPAVAQQLQELAKADPVPAADPVQPGIRLVDPSEIYTPEDLERHLLDVVARLEGGQLFERECIETEYQAVMAWELAKARTITTADGAADVRAAKALTDNQVEYEAAQLATMMRKATQAAMHNLRSVLSGYQSVAKSVLTTYQVGGSPGPANTRGR